MGFPSKLKIGPGDRFHRFTVIGDAVRAGFCIVRCDCGTIKDVYKWNVVKGRTKSCGCWRVEAGHQLAQLRHGDHLHGMTGTPEFKIWCGIKARCEIPSASGFGNYGKRGIKVCEAWQEFTRFFRDMGARPSEKHTVERKDTNGNYEPGNCRWATRLEQNRNRRNNVLLTHEGITRPMSEWAEIKGIKYWTLQSRIKKSKWSVERALSTEVL